MSPPIIRVDGAFMVAKYRAKPCRQALSQICPATGMPCDGGRGLTARHEHRAHLRRVGRLDAERTVFEDQALMSGRPQLPSRLQKRVGERLAARIILDADDGFEESADADRVERDFHVSTEAARC